MQHLARCLFGFCLALLVSQSATAADYVFTLYNNTTGNSNVATGAAALMANATGNNNVAVGRNALGLATGDGNIALGFQAGLNHTTGSNNIGTREIAPSGRVGGIALVPDSPLKVLRLDSVKVWKERALWWPERKGLVVAESIGTAAHYAVGKGPAGVHMIRRPLPPNTLKPFRPDHLLVGHGPPLHGDEADARSLEFFGAMQPLKDAKQAFGVGHVKAHAVISHEQHNLL